MASEGGLPTIYGIPLKYVFLVTLVVQNSALVLTMRYSRIQPGPRYLGTTAVALSELLKCFICLGIHVHRKRSQPDHRQAPTLSAEANPSNQADDYSIPLWIDGSRAPKIALWALVAFLYSLQNNLQFVAASHLHAATFQVTYQCKILTTALFTVTLLRRRLSARKWFSLVILTAGVAWVQIPSSSTAASKQQGDDLAGITAVAGACICSGLAGVCFEKVLKEPQQSSIWKRNVQLSAGCFPMALAAAYCWDRQAIRKDGFFQGYSPVVLATVGVQAAGGLIVALVIKYADNISKGFATSISIILSTAASIFLFDFVPTIHFLCGSILVLLATYLYSQPDAPKVAATVLPLYRQKVLR
ncbi:hypothetical protein, variant [Cladophialophora immunda]|uniref:UDP-galactose transporter n=1 Tax=Cladophialophora immunda TaxID=569365 RepID=A0A0D2BTI2_9EURO|nr:hypothetical protein, variant [Cladophialophora immunda]KIW21735.1 hypothetical protein, variant [Cladophialophora immunda]